MKFVHYEINQDLCRKCGACSKACPKHAIERTDDRIYVINHDLCDSCGTCEQTCKLRAITRKKGLFMH